MDRGKNPLRDTIQSGLLNLDGKVAPFLVKQRFKEMSWIITVTNSSFFHPSKIANFFEKRPTLTYLSALSLSTLTGGIVQTGTY